MPSEVLRLLWWMQLDKLSGNILQHHRTNINTRKHKEQYLKPKKKYHGISAAKEKSNQKSTQVQQLTQILHTHRGPDKPFHPRAKGGKKPFRRLFGKERNDRLVLHSNLLATKSQTAAKWTQEENLKTNHKPRLQTDTQHKVSVCVQKPTFSTLCQNRHHTNYIL